MFQKVTSLVFCGVLGKDTSEGALKRIPESVLGYFPGELNVSIDKKKER